MSYTSPAWRSVRVPSGNSTAKAPDSTVPTWRAWHHSPPTVGRTSLAQRQPGSRTVRATVRSPSSIVLCTIPENLTVSSGVPRFLTRALTSAAECVGRPPGIGTGPQHGALASTGGRTLPDHADRPGLELVRRPRADVVAQRVQLLEGG